MTRRKYVMNSLYSVSCRDCVPLSLCPLLPAKTNPKHSGTNTHANTHDKDRETLTDYPIMSKHRPLSVPLSLSLSLVSTSPPPPPSATLPYLYDGRNRDATDRDAL